MKKHGLSKLKIYSTHRSLITAKDNMYNPLFELFYTNKIDVCEEWKNKENGLINFYNWAMENGWDESRRSKVYLKDQSKDFCPDNCKVVYFD